MREILVDYARTRNRAKRGGGVAPIQLEDAGQLAAAPGVTFHCGDEHLYMEPGCAYWFDNQVMHSVANESGKDLISMLTDIRPFVSIAPD